MGFTSSHAINVKAYGIIAQHTGLLVRSPDSAVNELSRNMSSVRSREFFRSPQKVRMLADALYKLLSEDDLGNDYIYRYVEAIQRVSAETLAEDDARLALREKNYPGGPGYKRPEAHGLAAPITPRGTYERGARSNLSRSAAAHGAASMAEYGRKREKVANHWAAIGISDMMRGDIPFKTFNESGARHDYVGYAGGDKPINYRAPNHMRSGTPQQIGQAAWRAGTNLPESQSSRLQLHEPVKLFNGEVLHVPWTVMGSADRFRNWLMDRYAAGDVKVKRLVEQSGTHLPHELPANLRLGLDAARTVAGMYEKHGTGLKPQYPAPEGRFNRNEFGDRFARPAPMSAATRRLGVDRKRGWSEVEKMKIPFGQFRGMRVGDLMNPLLKTHRNRKTGRKTQTQAHDAIYYIAGMKNSTWVRDNHPEFHAAIYHAFTHHPALREMLQPYEHVNWFGGRSPRDLQIKYNPYRPSTWEHGMNVSLRDDDLPYYDRWESADRGHRLGYDIRKRGGSWVEEEESLILKSNMPGWMKRERLQDVHLGQAENEPGGALSLQGRIASAEYKRLQRRAEGVRWQINPDTLEWEKISGGPKVDVTREQRVQRLVDRMNRKDLRLLMQSEKIAGSKRYSTRPDIDETSTGLYDERLESTRESENQETLGRWVKPPRARRKHMRVIEQERASYKSEIDKLVAEGGTLEQLQELANKVEAQTEGGWRAIDLAQGELKLFGEGNKYSGELSGSDVGEGEEPDISLRSYFFLARGKIMARG